MLKDEMRSERHQNSISISIASEREDVGFRYIWGQTGHASSIAAVSGVVTVVGDVAGVVERESRRWIGGDDRVLVEAEQEGDGAPHENEAKEDTAMGY